MRSDNGDGASGDLQHVEKELYECAEMDFRKKPHVVIAAVTRTSGNGAGDGVPDPWSRLLGIEVESHETGARWTAQLTPRQLEELTAKTGNFKSFDTFVHMLAAAIRGNSSSVFVDLLTYADLDALRRLRKAGSDAKVDEKGSHVPNSVPSSTISKRYLILTYTGEFDRVHYPLPLSYEAEADAASLRRTCERLRAEMRALRNDSGRPVEATVTEKKKDDAELQRLRDELEKERAESATLRERLERAIEDGRVLQVELGRANEDREHAVARLEEAEAEVTALRRGSGRRAAPARLLEELSHRKASERELRIRVRQLASELSSSRSAPSSRRPSPGPASRSTSSLTSRRQSPAPGSRSSSPASGARARSSGKNSPARSGTPDRGRRRFDPTAYVREREQKLDLARRSRSAWSSPNGSRATSPSVSPARRRNRSPSPPAAHDDYRRSRREHERGREGLRAARPPLRQRPQPQQESGRVSDLTSRKPPIPPPPQSHSQPQAARGGSDDTVPRPIRKPGDGVMASSQPIPPIPQAGAFTNTSSEIADIDARLQALQDFLRSAKREGL